MIFRSLLPFVLMALCYLHPSVSPLIDYRPEKERPALYSDSILTGKVVGITDGDTFKLFLSDSTTIKIRIASIDCPERKQPFSTKAKQFTSEAIFSKQVRLAVQNKDRYGRYIATVYYGQKNLGKELLRYGMAWHYRQYSKDPELQQLEDQARAHKVGLWSDAHPMAPWEWRKGKRSSR